MSAIADTQLIFSAILTLFLTACNPLAESEAKRFVTPANTDASVSSAITPGSTPALASPPLPTATLIPPSSLIPSIQTEGVPVIEKLTTRKPALEQIASYLSQVNPQHAFEVRPSTQVFYQDVDGDGQDDLIVSSPYALSVFILLWNGSDYDPPYTFSEEPGHYLSETRVRIEDWTGDGVPEIVFDFWGVTGGLDTRHDYWKKQIIWCGAGKCEVVWHGFTGAVTTIDDLNELGKDLFSAEPVLVEGPNGNTILQLSHAFLLFDYYAEFHYFLPEEILKLDDTDCYGPIFSCPHHPILPSILKLYQWTGKTFAKTYEAQVSEPLALPKFVSGPADQFAQVITSSVPSPLAFDNRIEDRPCQLQIEGERSEKMFLCIPGYAQVDWIDLTGDQKPEVVVKGITHSDLREFLIAYRWDDRQLGEIANVSGDIVREDWYGVRLEDLDADGIPEIIAADGQLLKEACGEQLACWVEPNRADRAYKWNGQQFVFWKETPRK